MAFNSHANPPSQAGPSSQYSFNVAYAASDSSQSSSGGFDRGQRHPTAGKPRFDTLEWYPHYLTCQRYFLDHSQHLAQVQALAAFMNIQLPCQRHPYPIMSYTTPSPGSQGPDVHSRHSPFYSNINNGSAHTHAHPPAVSLIPYIRRLVATGQDSQMIMAGFFGNAWQKGVGEFHECERRNYLFASKSMPWSAIKQAYDMSFEETCPFLLPLRNAKEAELLSADLAWGEWMAHGDWMLGPRRPDILTKGDSTKIKTESRD